MDELNEIGMMSEEDVVAALRQFGIEVQYKPMAIMPNTMENYSGIGQKHLYNVDMDIYEALRKIAQHNQVMNILNKTK